MELYRKMHKVMSAIDRIHKDGKNAAANYAYASEKAIKETLHSAFVEVGILFKLDVVDFAIPEMQTGRNGETKITTVRTRYSFIDIDTGDKLEGEFIGSGNGRDDKGIYAAITGSIKYILTSTFLIPTGDDPEDDRYDVSERISEKKTESDSRPVPKPVPSSPPKPQAVKPVERSVPVPTPDPQADAGLKLSEDQQNVIISSFNDLGVEVWDLERVQGDHRSWTMADRRALLKKYTAIKSKEKEYSVKDFLEGREPT